MLPTILCNIFGLGGKQGVRGVRRVCPCNKNEEGFCELVMGWIEGEYYWRTDKQFSRIYDSYQIRRL